MTEFYSSIYYFLLDSQWIIVWIIVILAVIYVIKERSEESSENSALGTASGENSPIEEEAKMVLAAWQKKNWSNNRQKETDNAKEYVITQEMIDALEKTDPSGLFYSKFLTKIFPGKVISTLIEKSLSGELKAGNKVKIVDGEVILVR